jgi:hypothetical protein
MPRTTQKTSRWSNFSGRVNSKSFRGIPGRSVGFIRRRPLTSFFLSLLILFLLIAAGNLLFKQKTDTTPKAPQVKTVQVYNIGEVPKVTVQAQVQKDGVIVVMAQSAGVVQQVNVKPARVRMCRRRRWSPERA